MPDATRLPIALFLKGGYGVYATSASVRRLMQLQTRTDNAVNTPHQHH